MSRKNRSTAMKVEESLADVLNTGSQEMVDTMDAGAIRAIEPLVESQESSVESQDTENAGILDAESQDAGDESQEDEDLEAVRENALNIGDPDLSNQIAESDNEYIDMGKISEEIPLSSKIIDLSSNVAAAAKAARTIKQSNAPAVVKTPIVGERPKRAGTIILKFGDRSKTFGKHHQKDLLIECMEFFDPTNETGVDVEKVVKLIEERPDMLARMKTRQSVYRCVVYHAKQLLDIGYLI